MKTTNPPALKVADEVWVATALLHRELPDRSDFTTTEIEERARVEAAPEPLRPGVRVHAIQHGVANRPPNPGRYRMLFETARHRRRLYRPGDPSHPARNGSKIVPARSDLPQRYHELIDWYEREYARRPSTSPADDSLVALRGTGKAIWSSEHADEYVERLRRDW